MPPSSPSMNCVSRVTFVNWMPMMDPLSRNRIAKPLGACKARQHAQVVAPHGCAVHARQLVTNIVTEMMHLRLGSMARFWNTSEVMSAFMRPPTATAAARDCRRIPSTYRKLVGWPSAAASSPSMPWLVASP